MSRKRLGRIDPEAASRARDAAEQAATARPQAGPPIARMAAGVGQEIDAEIRRLRTELDALTAATTDLKTAEAEGRVILAVDLDQIDTGHLTRDRRVLNRDGEDWAVLKASLMARGQQTPVELSDLGEDASPRYGLISGLRRVSALRELLDETGQDRFALVLALIRPPEATPDKLIAMIEENEIRSGISFFERGRIAAMAASEGVFDDADASVEALFASSSRNRRYKIRCFVTVYETLGEQLAYPEAIGERLGIALAKAIREGAGADMTMQLNGYPDRSEAQELAILNNVVRGGVPGLEISARGRNAEPVMQASWTGAGKMKVRARARTGSNRVTLDIEGLVHVDEPSLQKLVRWMADQLEDTVQSKS
ncbi:MAG: nuclease [Pseudomonadota bacterium]